MTRSRQVLSEPQETVRHTERHTATRTRSLVRRVLAPCLAVAFLSVLLLWPMTTSARTRTMSHSQSIEIVGHFGGSPRAVAVQSHYAYMGMGPSLAILDITNPATPTLAGKTLPLSDMTVWDVTVSGAHAYVASSDAGLRVVDVSDPAHPNEIWFYETAAYASDVAVSGRSVYVASGNGGLMILRVPAQESPRIFLP